ncbi:C1 family peptidase [Endozoicomonas lisbonensis]|uniref:C1 family peptidase n=1 Tax=Endozoicomonas lisbonensis TaxID=3120522 RepID=UPI00339A4A1E
MYSAPVKDSSILDLKYYSDQNADLFYALFLERYKDESEKPERNTANYQKRKANFIENVNYALIYNAERKTSGKDETANINAFFDLSFDDFKNSNLGHKQLKSSEKKNTLANLSKTLIGTPYKHSNKVIPDALDWRKKGAVTAVKNQKQCGSCWTFGSIGALEGYYKIQGNPLTSLSEQFIGACNGVRPICEGGTSLVVYSFVVRNNFTLCTEESYPYSSGSGVDKACSTDHVNDCKKIKIPDGMKVRSIEPGNDKALMEALQDGPISVAIKASLKSFMLYKGGVYDDSQCLQNRTDSLDHEVLLVGYGTDNNIPYWIVKNSWGEQWGEDGYIRMRRGKTGSSDDQYNDMCGISLDAFQPVSLNR